MRDRISISNIQAKLDLERSRVLQLQTTLERDSDKVGSLSDEKLLLERDLDQQHAECRQLKNMVESLQVMIRWLGVVMQSDFIYSCEQFLDSCNSVLFNGAGISQV